MRALAVLALLLAACGGDDRPAELHPCELEPKLNVPAEHCGVVALAFDQAFDFLQARGYPVDRCQSTPTVYLISDDMLVMHCGTRAFVGCHFQGEIWVVGDLDDKATLRVVRHEDVHFLGHCSGSGSDRLHMDRRRWDGLEEI